MVEGLGSLRRLREELLGHTLHPKFETRNLDFSYKIHEFQTSNSKP